MGLNEVIFPEYKAKTFLSKYIPVSKDEVLDLKKAQLILKNRAIGEIKFPIVLKIVSDSVLHKTDIGGVKIAYNSDEFFKHLEFLLGISKKFKAQGILVEEFISGQELIIGLKKDDTFGHIIGLGIGGVFVEVLKSISFRKCPIDEEDFDSMLEDIKGREILFARKRQVNLDSLKKACISISKIPETPLGKKILELDVNPFMLNEQEGKAVDARIVFEK